MSVDTGLIDWVEEALAPMGQVSFRRMMGGATLYLDGTVFASVLDDALWFKSDAATDAVWDAAGCRRFTYDRKDGTTATMNYRRAPEDVLDDVDAMREWAGLAVEAGRRARVKAPKRKRAGKSPPA